jgi:hypothetical protein
MTEIYKLATLNINGLASQLRIEMLEDFLIKQEIDVLFLQEVTQPVFDNLRGYIAYTQERPGDERLPLRENALPSQTLYA